MVYLGFEPGWQDGWRRRIHYRVVYIVTVQIGILLKVLVKTSHIRVAQLFFDQIRQRRFLCAKTVTNLINILRSRVVIWGIFKSGTTLES